MLFEFQVKKNWTIPKFYHYGFPPLFTRKDNKNTQVYLGQKSKLASKSLWNIVSEMARIEYHIFPLKSNNFFLFPIIWKMFPQLCALEIYIISKYIKLYQLLYKITYPFLSYLTSINTHYIQIIVNTWLN